MFVLGLTKIVFFLTIVGYTCSVTCYIYQKHKWPDFIIQQTETSDTNMFNLFCFTEHKLNRKPFWVYSLLA